MKYHIVLWLDDIRDPSEYRCEYPKYEKESVIWCRSVNEAIEAFKYWSIHNLTSELVEINLDHDAGDYEFDGGDYIKFLDWMEEHGKDFTKYNWKIHSMNPIGITNMKRILNKNGVKI